MKEEQQTVFYKTKEEIELIRQSGIVLGKAHGEVAKMIVPGVKTIDLDKRAEEFIRDNGGIPSFKNYGDKLKFPYTLCISTNDQIVHGFPSNYQLKEGDIVSIDCGVKLNGFHSDSAYTYPIGEVRQDVKKLLDITKKSLYKAIDEIKIGKTIGDMSYVIQAFVEKSNFSVVRELMGHGIGKDLHEAPEVPNFGKKGRGARIREGLVIAIEPMINLGKKEIIEDEDGWTIRTKDGKPSAHFEHTVAILNGQVEILTTFEHIEAVFKN
ncbi:MAG: type I methionyl aminopeptidase [Cytophagales bacterium]|nr:MAG: type I methionyl aminopeptidase [Cytophagales bacterium]